MRSSWTYSRVLGLLLGLGASAFSLGTVQACAICFSGTVVTPGQKLDSADQAVLAVASASGGRFRVIAVVKGDVGMEDIIAESIVIAREAEITMSMDGQTATQKLSSGAAEEPLLLVRNRTSETWTSIGAIGEEYAGWLRQLAATKHGDDNKPARLWPSKVMAWSPLTDVEWKDRLALVWHHLGDSQALAAEIAYGELMRAPYGAMRTLKPRLDAETVRNWLADPNLSSRRSVYTLLLGIAGDQKDAADLERMIDQALLERDVTNLSAMIAADLELRGPARLDWLQATFFDDRNRTLPEIDAALLALSVHGTADAAVPRDRVVEAYLRFINARKPMAGFVAMELANWQAWDATAAYVDIIRSKAVKDPAGQFAILSYLKSSLLTAGQAALLPDE